MKKLLRAMAARQFGKIVAGYSRTGDISALRTTDVRAMRISFSQLGEDLIIYDLLRSKSITEGVFVDVGAFHPTFYSNTRLLSLKGWKGINIDIDEDKIAVFDQMRPDDQNLVAAISRSKNQLLKLEYSSSATNRIVSADADCLTNAHGEPPIRKSLIQTRTLEDVLESSPFSTKKVELVDIDCEGHDFEVLKSFDIEKLRPAVLCIEALNESQRSVVESYLVERGYQMHAQIGITLIFDRKHKE